MNHYEAWCVKNCAVILGSVLICLISGSAWGILGFLCLSTLSEKDDKDKKEKS
jgi:hypothetical protein